MNSSTHFLQFIRILAITILLLLPSVVYGEQCIKNETNQCMIPTSSSLLDLSAIMDDIDQPLIEDFLTDLVSFGSRKTGTTACQQAGEYIFNQFTSFGLETNRQNWTRFGSRYNPHLFNGFNVIGTLPGTNPESTLEIVFNAHYDSVHVSPGADDDGSGVAAVLAAASALSTYSFDHTIHFVCFSGEEQGLLGSRSYSEMLYENLTDTFIIEFNADGIGYAPTEELEHRFRMWGTEDVSWLMDQIEELNSIYNLNFTLEKRLLPEHMRGGSDYYSFVRYGMESIAFFEGDWNPHWHSKNDTIANMNLPYLTRTTKLITLSIAWLSDAPITYPYVSITTPTKGRLYINGENKQKIPDSQERWNVRTLVIDNIMLNAEVFVDESLIEKVEFYVQDRLKHTDTEAPYTYELHRLSLFHQHVEVVAYSTNGQTAADWINLFFINLTPFT